MGFIRILPKSGSWWVKVAVGSQRHPSSVPYGTCQKNMAQFVKVLRFKILPIVSIVVPFGLAFRILNIDFVKSKKELQWRL